MLPQLTKLDNVEVSAKERQEANEFMKEEHKSSKQLDGRSGSKVALGDASNANKGQRSTSPFPSKGVGRPGSEN